MEKKNIGHTVRLNDLNKVYMTFRSAFKAMGFNNQMQNPHSPHVLRESKGEFFKVFTVGKGQFSELIGIQDEHGNQILVKEIGVTLVKRSCTRYSDNFNL